MTEVADRANLIGVGEEYLRSWRRFVDDLESLALQIDHKSRPEGAPLHDILTELLWVPYNEAHRIVEITRVDASSRNAGAISGLFFEYAACAVIVPQLRARAPGCRYERNQCSNEIVRSVARDPDLYVTFNDRHVVFEFKASPKRRDFAALAALRNKYAAVGAEYFLIGGAAYVAAPLLEGLAREGWGCVLASSAANEEVRKRLPRLEALVTKAVSHLCAV